MHRFLSRTFAKILSTGFAFGLAATVLGAAACGPSISFFAKPTRFSIGRAPTASILKDINNDGKLDLIVTRAWSRGEISVLLGLGDGSFGGPVAIITARAPKFPLVADLNGDGKMDLAVTDFVEGGYVTVLPGNGDGTFGTPAHFLVGKSASAVKAADLNGDGKLDLVVTNFEPDVEGVTEILHGNVTILLGHGDGTFDAARTRDIDGSPRGVTVGDWNSDGKIDLAVGDDGRHRLLILLGRGDGTFADPTYYYNQFGAFSVTSFDLNKDGKADLLVGHTGVSVFLGNGDGTFLHSGDFPSPGGRGVFCVDYDGDGNADIAGTRRMLLGDGRGHFRLSKEYDVWNDEGGTSAGDVNGDGRVDLLVTDTDRNRISVYLNKGSGNPVVSTLESSGRQQAKR